MTSAVASATPPGSAEKPALVYYIDVCSHCNLRCPSCPVGNWPDSHAPADGALMSTDLLRRLLAKAVDEAVVKSVGLYNWTEPLLHPQLPELIGLVKSFGLVASVSTNLNVLRREDDLLASGADWLRVSVSGFAQEVYVRGHRRGDVEKVKRNLVRLAAARDRQHAATVIEVFYHRYSDNEADEAPMRAFAADLGFSFVTAWAHYTPVEKLLTYLHPDRPLATLTPDDRAVIERLALEPRQAAAIGARHHLRDCELYGYLTLDTTGQVYLCCAVSNRAPNRLGSYLELPLAEIQARQRRHPLCAPCLAAGVPIVYCCADPELDAMAQRERRRGAARSAG